MTPGGNTPIIPEDYDGYDDAFSSMLHGNRRRWHVNKSIDLGNLLIMLGMLISALMWLLGRLNTQDLKISSVDEAVKQEKMINERQDVDARSSMGLVNRKLDNLDDKVTRILERGQKR